MFKIISSFADPITAASLYEAQTIMGREYNLKLADILIECPNANPVRKMTDESAFITWNGDTISWHIEIVENIAA